jgi:hypothetical protein
MVPIWSHNGTMASVSLSRADLVTLDERLVRLSAALAM